MGGHTVHRLPNKPPPAWMQTLMQSHKHSPGKTILGSIFGTFVLSAGFWSYFMARGTKVHTLGADWQAANKDYMKFQNMNPIFGVSSK